MTSIILLIVKSLEILFIAFESLSLLKYWYFSASFKDSSTFEKLSSPDCMAFKNSLAMACSTLILIILCDIFLITYVTNNASAEAEAMFSIIL